jgi:hypothetical protein
MASRLGGWGGLEEVPDATRKMAFEAADGFLGALAFGAFAVDVLAGFWVAAGADVGRLEVRGRKQ